LGFVFETIFVLTGRTLACWKKEKPRRFHIQIMRRSTLILKPTIMFIKKLVKEVEAGESPNVHQSTVSNKENDMVERLLQRTDDPKWDPQLSPLSPCKDFNTVSESEDNVYEAADVGAHTYLNPNQRKRADSSPPGAKCFMPSGP
jgi:hypothetical protein